ncbi:imidazole glycerol phosphate synthase subunit HisH [Pelagibacteraceae bacterium]|nr:imidazole glycerol phosphate synthase subunit HisH [Pelagibacteraceae bacterium]
MLQITIVDYGSGNVLSAQQSFIKVTNDNKIEAKVLISKNLNDIKNSTHIVLPGQGAFSTCMSGLKNTPGLVEELYDFAIIKQKPFLGICVGMQMLAIDSEENGLHQGLGWIKGNIKILPDNKLKMPHMGWNVVNPINNNKLINTPKDYYFVHSYYFECQNKENIMAESQYGINFASIVGKENIYGVQFHPEKSSSQGLNLIKNFIS